MIPSTFWIAQIACTARAHHAATSPVPSTIVVKIREHPHAATEEVLRIRIKPDDEGYELVRFRRDANLVMVSLDSSSNPHGRVTASARLVVAGTTGMKEAVVTSVIGCRSSRDRRIEVCVTPLEKSTPHEFAEPSGARHDRERRSPTSCRSTVASHATSSTSRRALRLE